jgi:hypothetical protein
VIREGEGSEDDGQIGERFARFFTERTVVLLDHPLTTDSGTWRRTAGVIR